MAYVMAFNNKYFGLIFADTADGKSYTDKPAKAHRFATEQDVTPEARKNFARVVTDLYNQLAPDNRTFRPSSVYIDDESTYESKESPMKCSMLKKKESLTKVAESIDGAVFTLKSCNVEVHEDSYEDGEGAFVNAWDLKEYDGMRFNSLQEVIDLIANRGIYNKDYTKPENWMAFEYRDEDGILRLDTDVLVDRENYPADDNDIERWKKGELELYNAHYNVYVRCEYTAVVPKDAIEKETKDLGFDTSYLE